MNSQYGLINAVIDKSHPTMSFLLHSHHELLLLLCLLIFLQLCSQQHSALASSDDDAIDAEFKKLPWLNWKQVKDVYNEEYKVAALMGKLKMQNTPRRSRFYPEGHVLEGNTVVLVCQLMPSEKAHGYRTNSITLSMLEQGYHLRRSLLAPIKKIHNTVDQLNCWNYAQESVCHPSRDCGNIHDRRTGLHTVGIITKEGWGVFQLRAGADTQAHYQCSSELQSVLDVVERQKHRMSEFQVVNSDIMELKVYKSEIGMPKLHMPSSFDRGSPLKITCRVPNSRPGCQFDLALVLMRPPPTGEPGSDHPELLISQEVQPEDFNGAVTWHGEYTLLEHHGLLVVCEVRGDWGSHKGFRRDEEQLQVHYMFPVYVDNPRISHEMKSIWGRSYSMDYYKTPSTITLRQAEYVTCKSTSYPQAKLHWTFNDTSQALWAIEETLFVSKHALIGRSYPARCIGEHTGLGVGDEVSVRIVISSAGQALLLPPGLLYICFALVPIVINAAVQLCC